MAGWIRAYDHRLVNVNHAAVIRAISRRDGDSTLYQLAAIAPDDEETHLSVMGDMTQLECEIEFNRLQAWLHNGGEGVYVVGEWPYPHGGIECESCGAKATHMDPDGGTFCCECWLASGGGEISREPAGDGAVAGLVKAAIAAVDKRSVPTQAMLRLHKAVAPFRVGASS